MADIADSNRIKLHIGAHRTGSTSLQAALHGQRAALSQHGIGYWGPFAMRTKRFPGVFQSHGAKPLTVDRLALIDEIVKTNAPLLAKRLDYQQREGHGQIILSEENILGAMHVNFNTATLYPDVTHRLMVFSKIFGPYCQRVSITIRSYESYWRSLIAFLLSKGGDMPTARKLEALTQQPTRWRHVIETVRAAFPNAKIRVMDFERWVGQYEAQIDALFGAPLSLPTQPNAHKNASLDRAHLYLQLVEHGAFQAAAELGPEAGIYQPFSAPQIAHMQAAYAEDLSWLKHGGLPRVRLLTPGETG